MSVGEQARPVDFPLPGNGRNTGSGNGCNPPGASLDAPGSTGLGDAIRSQRQHAMFSRALP
eukprot:1316520-Karenia_brevis.AAC.1